MTFAFARLRFNQDFSSSRPSIPIGRTEYRFVDVLCHTWEARTGSLLFSTTLQRANLRLTQSRATTAIPRPTHPIPADNLPVLEKSRNASKFAHGRETTSESLACAVSIPTSCVRTPPYIWCYYRHKTSGCVGRRQPYLQACLRLLDLDHA